MSVHDCFCFCSFILLVFSVIAGLIYSTHKEDEIMDDKEVTNKWIPVSERLPEKNMACLVAVGKFNLTQMAMYSDLMETIDHRIFYQGDYGRGNFEDITQYVKAWMPLPKPYEPHESDDKCENCKYYFNPDYTRCHECKAESEELSCCTKK